MIATDPRPALMAALAARPTHGDHDISRHIERGSPATWAYPAFAITKR